VARVFVHRRDSMKKIDTSAHIGNSGIALIHQVVNKMGFVWHALA
jgi:hypothetical protein